MISNSLLDIRFISFFAILFGAFIIILLERIFPYTKGQRFLREGFFNDFILYALLQSYVLGLVISLRS